MTTQERTPPRANVRQRHFLTAWANLFDHTRRHGSTHAMTNQALRCYLASHAVRPAGMSRFDVDRLADAAEATR